MDTYTINGKSIEFDTFDVETFGRFQREANKIAGEVSVLGSRAKEDPVAYMTGVCTLIRGFFDEVIAPGTSSALFGDRNNFRDIMTAYTDFAAQVVDQANAFAPNRPKPVNKGKRSHKGKR